MAGYGMRLSAFFLTQHEENELTRLVYWICTHGVTTCAEKVCKVAGGGRCQRWKQTHGTNE